MAKIITSLFVCLFCCCWFEGVWGFSTSLSLWGKFWSPYLGKAQQQPQEQRYPFLSMHVVFPCVLRMLWLPVFGIFNVRTDADASDCTRGLYGHRKRVDWGKKKKSLATPGTRARVIIASGFSVGRSSN